jgi:hypothetical protein
MPLEKRPELIVERYKEAFRGIIGTILEGGVTDKKLIEALFQKALKEAGERFMDEHQSEIDKHIVGAVESALEAMAKKREPAW